jgi:hypothetical protein
MSFIITHFSLGETAEAQRRRDAEKTKTFFRCHFSFLIFHFGKPQRCKGAEAQRNIQAFGVVSCDLVDRIF